MEWTKSSAVDKPGFKASHFQSTQRGWEYLRAMEYHRKIPRPVYVKGDQQ